MEESSDDDYNDDNDDDNDDDDDDDDDDDEEEEEEVEDDDSGDALSSSELGVVLETVFESPPQASEALELEIFLILIKPRKEWDPHKLREDSGLLLSGTC